MTQAKETFPNKNTFEVEIKTLSQTSAILLF